MLEETQITHQNETLDLRENTKVNSIENDVVLVEKSLEFYNLMKKRRTVRSFSDKEVPKAVIENAILAAGTAPNGANKQPWKFVAISSMQVKKKLQEAVESVEREFYTSKTPKVWLDDLKKFGTNADKPYLTKAPYIIAVFSQLKSEVDGGKTYYPIESTGIATGILLTSLHQSGLATLTHTPRPMKFLNKLLDVDKSFRPFLLVVIGHPKLPLNLPDISKKNLNQIAKFI